MQGLRARGFSLIEVLVALVIIAVGMLGLAKLQALAYASTGTASLRSLAALEASSLAAAMRADRLYWSAPPAALAVTFAGTAITSSDAALTGTTSCLHASNATPCTAAQVAAYDLQQWITTLNTGMLPNPTAAISCPTPVAGPIACSIQISWAERSVAVNAQAASVNVAAASAGTSAMAAPTYTLYVEP
jgi:type IV pilus assembly protein PilV